MKKLRNWIIKIWNDPVGSKIISAGILTFIAIAWASYKDVSVGDIYKFIILTLNFKIPLYFLLSFVGLYFLIIFVLKYFKKKPDPILNESIGNYKFSELYKILEQEILPFRNRNMEINKIPADTDNMLTQFKKFSIILNTGLDDDSASDSYGYLSGVLCPKLMQYWLIDKIDGFDFILELPTVKYQTLQLGYKFLSSIDKQTLRKKEQSRNTKLWLY